MKIISLSALAATSLFSLSAHAVDATINVTAEVKPTLEFVQANDQPLPADYTFSYKPATGLDAYTLSTKLLTNQDKIGFKVRLQEAAVLKGTDVPDVPLTVSFAGEELSTSDKSVDFNTYMEKFELNASNGAANSKNLELKVSQKTQGPLPAAQYAGAVKISVTQTP